MKSLLRRACSGYRSPTAMHCYCRTRYSLLLSPRRYQRHCVWCGRVRRLSGRHFAAQGLPTPARVPGPRACDGPCQPSEIPRQVATALSVPGMTAQVAHLGERGRSTSGGDEIFNMMGHTTDPIGTVPVSGKDLYEGIVICTRFPSPVPKQGA
jgi:hypothetical protein